MPKPRPGETKDEFIERCIPIVIADKTAKDGSQGNAICNSIWERKDLESTYLLDDYVVTTPGEPFRLFPFGKLVKGGETHDLTPDYARRFKLPHFKPPIKRGGHGDTTPAGGHIVGLEVREDGLYAIPEWNEPGIKAVTDGDYRYQSPEVIWDEGPVYEDPTTGEYIHGPLIVGDALLHTPHLGEAAALYSVEPITKEEIMTDNVELVEVPKKGYEGILQFFSAKPHDPEPEPDPKPAVEIEAFDALAKERDEYKAELDRLQAEADKKARVDKFTAAVAETKANAELVEILAGLPDETADRIIQEFKALSAQIDESKLTGELGTSGDAPADPAEALNKAVAAKMEALKISDWNQALRLVVIENPELANYKEGK
jgi:hypothetical protein